MATNGGDVLASELMAALLTGEDVSIPTIDFSGSEYSIPGDINSDAYDVLVKLSDSDLTTGAINGTGAFDKLMVGVAAQLQREYDAGRITGAEYSKSYITLTQSALATSLQFLLGKDASYWQAVQAQTQAVIARVQLATVKAENARAQIEALTAKSNYALTKLKLATEDVQYGSLKYKLDNIDPLQVTQLTLQNSGITTSNLGLSINNDIASYNLTTTLPKQSLMLDAQTAQTIAQTSHIGKQELATVQQTSNLESQQAQVETETNKLIYELTYRIPEEVQLIKLNQDQVIAQNNKVATDTIIAIKQGHLVDAQTCQVSSETNRIKAEVALKLPEEVELVKLNQLQLTAQTDQTTYTTQHLLPAQLAQITGETSKINYEVLNILPKQKGLLTEQTLQVTAQTDGVTKTNVGIDTANSIASYNLTTVLPKQQEILVEQLATAVVDKNTKSYNLTDILPVQKLSLQEQAEAQRGQTMDTRSDGTTPIAGSIGKQNSLYTQQVVSYQKDSQLKAAKVFSDVWITCRSIDEGFPLPTQFDTAATQAAMQAIIDANDLG